MSVSIDIRRLSPVTITRQRGREALDRLLELAPLGAKVEIDLTKVELVSTSFLDALILGLGRKEGGSLERFVFVIKDQDSLDRLEKICSLRHVSGYYRWSSDTAVRKISNQRILRRRDTVELAKERLSED